MEFGVAIILLAIAIGGLFAEHTKIGGKITYFIAKNFCGVDLDKLED